MKAYLISDNVDTQVGMRLAGIKGIIVHDRDEVLRELKNATSSGNYGIILITEKLASLAREEVDKIKLNINVPLVIEIPDRHGTTRSNEYITKYVKESIGLRI